MNDSDRHSEPDRHRARLEIVEELIRALESGAQVFELVYASADRAAARDALMQAPWGFSELVATHILDIPLGRTVELGRADLAKEQGELRRLLGST